MAALPDNAILRTLEKSKDTCAVKALKSWVIDMLNRSLESITCIQVTYNASHFFYEFTFTFGDGACETACYDIISGRMQKYEQEMEK